MARTKTVYRCSECGAEHSKWQGRCDTCGEWNTLVEESVAPKVAMAAGGAARRIGGTRTLGEGGSVATTPRLRDISGSDAKRWKTGLDEFDFVVGGGIVPGSMVLIGGEPGIGKSTLLLQVAARLGALRAPTLVVHGTEDQMLPVGNGPLIASQIPGARLEILDGVGHMFFWEQPERSAELIRSHAAVPA